MKINSKEMLLLNRNMKFGEVPTETMPKPAETVTEPPVTEPETGLNVQAKSKLAFYGVEQSAPETATEQPEAESGMNALNVQAQNNVSFQGVTLPSSVRKGLSKMMLILALGGAAATTTTMTSCTIENSNDVEVDMSAFTELIAQLNAKMDEMIEQQKISNELSTEIKNIQLENQKILQNLYKNSQLTLAEVQNLSLTVQNGIFEVTEQLKENGATDKEILETVKNIRTQINGVMTKLQNGQISFAKALQEIQEILGSIDGTLKDILEQVIGIRDDMNANHAEYMSKKDEELEYLSGIYQNGKANEQWLKFMSNGLVVMNENLVKINNNTASLLAIASDDTKYNELMNKLSELKPNDIDYQKFEEMFKLLNMNIQDAINDFKADNKAGQKALIEVINAFKNTYISTEQKQSQQLTEITNKLTFIATYLPNLDQSDAIAAIDKLTAAMDKNTGAVEDNTEVIGNGLDNINSKLDAVLEKLDKVIDNISGLSTYFSEQQQNWNVALGSLGDINKLLEKVLKEQKTTNTTLSSFKADFQEIKDNQKTANSYLNILISKQSDLEKAIKNLNINGGMTREEFLSAMEERDAKVAAEFKKFISDYGFDKVPGDVQTIKEFLAEIKNAVNNQKDYSSQLDRIINLENDIYNFLKNADFSNPDYTKKLNEILEAIKNWKCNCECGTSSGKTDESVKDLEDMFG